MLGVLAEGAPALVRRVAPGNLGAFAALFTAALLQAAATGEALLDEELGSLAARDPSRFARLNSRMQVRCCLPVTVHALQGHPSPGWHCLQVDTRCIFHSVGQTYRERLQISCNWKSSGLTRILPISLWELS